jgi:hypothetical protein
LTVAALRRGERADGSQAGEMQEGDETRPYWSGVHFSPAGRHKRPTLQSENKFCRGLPANPQKPVFASRSAHLHIMHPEPKHLKNFARNSQWIRGKNVRNIAFFSRFQ